MHNNKEKTLTRLKRLEGQVRGVSRMVAEDRYCVDILTQTAAIRAALNGVEKLVIDDHASHCIDEALAGGDAEEHRTKFRALVHILAQAQN